MLTYNEFLLENFKKPWVTSLPKGTSSSELYRYVNYIANQLGEELVGEFNLGSGTYGTAFELKSGKVLKLTEDQNEAKMAQWLKNHNTTYLINCYSIYEVIPDNLYVLLMDKLDMLDEKDVDLRIIWDNILTYINYSPEVILSQDLNGIINEISSDVDIIDDYEMIKNYIEDNWDSIYGITKELISLNIMFPDIHTGNLGYDKNHNIIYFDVREMKKKQKNRKDLSQVSLKKLDITPFFKGTTFH